MKWPTLSPQKQMCTLCGLIIIFAAIVIADHIVLRRETTWLRQAIIVTAARAGDKSDTSGDIEQTVNNLQSKLRSVELDLGRLQSDARSADDYERRISSLEVLVRRLDGRIDDVAGTPSTTIGSLKGEVESLKRKIDQHGGYIREIMGKVGMWLPADLLGR